MAETTTIYVSLVDEGVDCWRPVQAEHRGGDVYRIIDQPYDRSVEWWRFGPGDSVLCEMRELSGEPALVAVRCCAAPEDVMFAEAWVKPLYQRILHANYLSLPREEVSEFVRDARVLRNQVTEDVLDRLLADHTPGGWRERITGGWLVGVMKHQGYVDRVGELLLKGQYLWEDQAHSFALAAIGSTACVAWLDRVLDQEEAPGSARIAKAWLNRRTDGSGEVEATGSELSRFDQMMQFCDRWFWSEEGSL